MIRLVKGNIFDSKCIALVNPVNCVGVCGKGLALDFKKKFPQNYVQYKEHCLGGYMRLGRVFITIDSTDSKYDNVRKYIVNFPTKNHWRNKSELSNIVDGLRDLNDYMSSSGIYSSIISIAFPLLGCGLGGLSKEDVIQLIRNFDQELTLRQVDNEFETMIDIYVNEVYQ